MAVFAQCTASLLPGACPAAVGALRQLPRRPVVPLCGPAVGCPDDGVNGDTRVVGGHTPGHHRLHGSGQPSGQSRAGRFPPLARFAVTPVA